MVEDRPVDEEVVLVLHRGPDEGERAAGAQELPDGATDEEDEAVTADVDGGDDGGNELVLEPPLAIHVIASACDTATSYGKPMATSAASAGRNAGLSVASAASLCRMARRSPYMRPRCAAAASRRTQRCARGKGGAGEEGLDEEDPVGVDGDRGAAYRMRATESLDRVLQHPGDRRRPVTKRPQRPRREAQQLVAEM